MEETPAMTISCLAIVATFAASPSPTAPAQGTPRSTSIVCTEQYAPVCGRAGNVTRTFPNPCYARAAGAEIVAPGPCGEVPARPPAR
jgi:hypothetical protein